MYAVVDGKLTNDLDSAYIFRKLISNKLSGGSSGYLYMRYRMNFVADPVQNQTPQFMDMGFSNINALYDRSGLSTPSTRIRRPAYGAHWIMPNNVFGEATALGTSEV